MRRWPANAIGVHDELLGVLLSIGLLVVVGAAAFAGGLIYVLTHG